MNQFCIFGINTSIYELCGAKKIFEIRLFNVDDEDSSRYFVKNYSDHSGNDAQNHHQNSSST
jgi:hypothetical protein